MLLFDFINIRLFFKSFLSPFRNETIVGTQLYQNINNIVLGSFPFQFDQPKDTFRVISTSLKKWKKSFCSMCWVDYEQQ